MVRADLAAAAERFVAEAGSRFVRPANMDLVIEIMMLRAFLVDFSCWSIVQNAPVRKRLLDEFFGTLGNALFPGAAANARAFIGQRMDYYAQAVKLEIPGGIPEKLSWAFIKMVTRLDMPPRDGAMVNAAEHVWKDFAAILNDSLKKISLR